MCLGKTVGVKSGSSGFRENVRWVSKLRSRRLLWEAWLEKEKTRTRTATCLFQKDAQIPTCSMLRGKEPVEKEEGREQKTPSKSFPARRSHGNPETGWGLALVFQKGRKMGANADKGTEFLPAACFLCRARDKAVCWQRGKRRRAGGFRVTDVGRSFSNRSGAVWVSKGLCKVSGLPRWCQC